MQARSETADSQSIGCWRSPSLLTHVLLACLQPQNRPSLEDHHVAGPVWPSPALGKGDTISSSWSSSILTCNFYMLPSHSFGCRSAAAVCDVLLCSQHVTLRRGILKPWLDFSGEKINSIGPLSAVSLFVSILHRHVFVVRCVLVRMFSAFFFQPSFFVSPCMHYMNPPCHLDD